MKITQKIQFNFSFESGGNKFDFHIFADSEEKAKEQFRDLLNKVIEELK